MSSCNCVRTPSLAKDECVQIEPMVFAWLEETGGLIRFEDKRGRPTGLCTTALGPLVTALQGLVPSALSINDYVLRLNELAGLGNVDVFLSTLAGATASEKTALTAALTQCVRSADAPNDIALGSDGGLVAFVTAQDVVDRLGSDAAACGALAAGLISADPTNSITQGSDGKLFENDAT